MPLPTLPTFRLFAGDKDITSALMPLISSITVTEETGYISDALDLEIADPNGVLELPRVDSWLRLSLGYSDGVLKDFGRYAVKTVKAKGPPDVISVHATATPMAGARPEATAAFAPVKQSLQEVRNISYDAGTMSKLLAEVCIRSGLLFRAPVDVWHIPIPHIDQTKESDLALVSRLAEANGCIVKVVGTMLVLTRRSAAQTVSGTPLTPRTILPADISDWGCEFGGIKPYRSAICRYHDKKSAQLVEVRVGTDPPVYEHPYDFSDRDSAESAAKAVLQRSSEGTSILDFRMPMDVTLTAEQPVILAGFRDGLNGKWLISRVEHRFEKTGAVTSLQGRQST